MSTNFQNFCLAPKNKIALQEAVKLGRPHKFLKNHEGLELLLEKYKNKVPKVLINTTSRVMFFAAKLIKGRPEVLNSIQDKKLPHNKDIIHKAPILKKQINE